MARHCLTPRSSGELALTVDVAQITSILLKLREDNGGGFTQLTELTAVDYPERSKRFELVYQLLSVNHNQRIRLLAPIADGDVVRR